MTIYGKETLFCDDQDLGANAAGAYYSENDLRVGPGDFGQGEDIKLDVIVTEAFATTDSVKVALVTDSALPIDGSSIVLQETEAILTAVLVAGYKFKLKSIPPGCLKYIGLKFTLAGASSSTAGKITSGLTPDTQDSDPSF